MGDDNRAFLVFAVIVFALVSFAVIQLREGTVGRTLRALRGSEVAAESIGISPTRARMTAFAISAFIAGLGGALLAIQQKNVNYTNNFAPFAALFWVVIVVSLGSRTVEGAAQAGAAFALFDTIILRGEIFGWILRSSDRIPGFFPISPKWRFVLFGLGTIQFARHPEGLVENGKRKSLARMERRFGNKSTDDVGSASSSPPSDADADAAALAVTDGDGVLAGVGAGAPAVAADGASANGPPASPPAESDGGAADGAADAAPAQEPAG
jgi:hypothetical protein